MYWNEHIAMCFIISFYFFHEFSIFNHPVYNDIVLLLFFSIPILVFHDWCILGLSLLSRLSQRSWTKVTMCPQGYSLLMKTSIWNLMFDQIVTRFGNKARHATVQTCVSVCELRMWTFWKMLLLLSMSPFWASKSTKSSFSGECWGFSTVDFITDSCYIQLDEANGAGHWYLLLFFFFLVLSLNYHYNDTDDRVNQDYGVEIWHNLHLCSEGLVPSKVSKARYSPD